MFDVVLLQELGREIAGMDPRAMSDDELCTKVPALSELRSMLNVGLAHLVNEVDSREVADREHGLTTPSWYARTSQLPRSVARRDVTVAKKLRSLPEVDEAWTEGRINAHHVGVLVDACNPRITDEVVARQGELIDLAEGLSVDVFRDRVRGLVRLWDQDGAYDPAEDVAANKLVMAKTSDDITYLSGQLTGEHAEVVTQAIETKADELFRRHRADHDTSPDLPIPERTTLRALALYELCRTAQGVNLDSTVAPRADVTVVVRAGELTEATDLRGVRLSDGTTRTLLCDPEIHAVIVDRSGLPLDVGRQARLATPAQRRALIVRDGGCVFPGCDAPVAWCDAHHVVHFEHGGRTDTSNLVLLCRHHHGVTHRKGWRMHATGDGWFTWTTPTGRTIGSEHHGRRRAEPAPPAAA